MATVPRQHTPVAIADLPDLLSDGYGATTGHDPEPGHIRLALAQLELEHGVEAGALRAVYNWNLGNQDAGEGWTGDTFCTVPECEGVSCSSHAVHQRRAYASPEEGAAGYWQVMTERYPKALEAMARDDAAGFVRELKLAGYFTGDEGAYLRAVAWLERHEAAV